MVLRDAFRTLLKTYDGAFCKVSSNSKMCLLDMFDRYVSILSRFFSLFHIKMWNKSFNLEKFIDSRLWQNYIKRQNYNTKLWFFTCVIKHVQLFTPLTCYIYIYICYVIPTVQVSLSSDSPFLASKKDSEGVISRILTTM